jgi:hypothetical protein
MIMRRTIVSAFATLLATASLTLSAYAQSSTAFTYQGFLKENNNPANAKYDLQVHPVRRPHGRQPRSATPSLSKTCRLRTACSPSKIDFGINRLQQGQRRWIEIAVRPFDSTRRPLSP